MKIANIVYGDELVNHDKVDYINYYKEDSLYDLDPLLPTLWVGWGLLKKLDLDVTVNILKHRIKENLLYWEFSFEENKASHINGVASFVKNTPHFYFNPKYNYTNLDPVFHQLKDVRDIFDVLPKKLDGYYALKNRVLYILSGDQIYGLDLEMYKFFKFDIQGIMDRLHDITDGPHFHDPDGEHYEKYYKIFPEFTLLKRYLVVLVTN